MEDRYDAIVVGGGIVGTSTAYHLAHNDVDTLLVDRDDDGRATDAGAGIVSPATSSRTESDAWFEFAVGAFEYYPALAARLEAEQDGPTSFDRPGLLTVAADDDELEPFADALERTRDRQQRLGHPEPSSLEELDPAAAADRLPGLASVERAFEYTNAARVDGRVFTAALRRASENAGLDVVDGDVTGLEISDATVQGVAVDETRTVAADRVVVAGGAWSSRFETALEFEVPVEPQRGQIAQLYAPNAATDEWPIVGGFRHHYLVPWDDGRVAVGATRETGSGFTPRTTAAGVRTVLDEALRLVPGLADARVDDVRVGLRPASADGLPILGESPTVDGVYLATGHGPTGLTLGPYSGKRVADLLCGAEPTDDLEPFAPGRFATT